MDMERRETEKMEYRMPGAKICLLFAIMRNRSFKNAKVRRRQVRERGMRNSDFPTSQENALAHFYIVARASCPCFLEIFHGRDAHATKNVPVIFPKTARFACRNQEV
jgi:hypothetical protein